MISKEELIAFEADIAHRFEAGEVKGPIHLSGGNEDQLIRIFQEVRPHDWIFSTYRSHYHALLHGVPPDLVRERILAGHSMNLKWPEYRFFTSAIVGGCLPIAVGVAVAIRRLRAIYGEIVWCFVGDMCATTGAFHDAVQYADGWNLPIQFVVENNGHSVCTPTAETWDMCIDFSWSKRITHYLYTSPYPHWSVRKGDSF